MLKLVSSAVAQKTIQSAVDYYDQIEPALTEAFLTELWACYDRIEVFPLLFPKCYDEIRMAVLSEFSQRVYYSVSKDQVVILAVLHTSREETQYLKP